MTPAELAALEAARAAQQEWTRQQLGGRGTAAYRRAYAEMRRTSRALLAARRAPRFCADPECARQAAPASDFCAGDEK